MSVIKFPKHPADHATEVILTMLDRLSIEDARHAAVFGLAYVVASCSAPEERDQDIVGAMSSVRSAVEHISRQTGG